MAKKRAAKKKTTKKKAKKKKSGPVVLYGGVMIEAAASGNLSRMKSAAKQAEKHLSQHGDVAAALEALKIEIAKLESGR